MLTTLTFPLNSVFSSGGTVTDTLTISDPASGVKSEPLSGINVQTPHSGYSETSQLSSEPSSPAFSTVKIPVTVELGDTSTQLNSPSHSRSGILASYIWL